MANRLDSTSACVPSDIAGALRDIGQWRARAEAMDQLQQHVRAMESIPQKDVSGLVTFILSLVKDPNFKISVSAMNLLAHVARTSKSAMHRHIGAVTPPLLEKLMDGKLLMRQSAHLVFTALLKSCGPQAVLPQLVSHSSHFAWRVREELVNVYITAMLLLSPTSFDWPSTARFLLDLLDDAKQRVRLAALEAFGVLASKVADSRLRNILMAIDCSPSSQKLILERAQSPDLPRLNSEGYVQHVVDLDAASANGFVPPPSYQPPASPYGRLPFAIPTPGSSRRGSRSDARTPPAPLSAEHSDSFQEARPRSRRSQRAQDGMPFPQLQPLSVDPLELTDSMKSAPTVLRKSRTTSDQSPVRRPDNIRTSADNFENSCLAPPAMQPSPAQLRFGWLDRSATQPHPRAAPWAAERRNPRIRPNLSTGVAGRNDAAHSSQESVPLRMLAARRSGGQQGSTEGDRSNKSTRSSGDAPCARGSSDSLPPVATLRLSAGRDMDATHAAGSLAEGLLQGVQGVGMSPGSPAGQISCGQRVATGGALMHLASAPSSDAMQGSPSAPDSPTKAERLRHLKQLQAHRRAQSAGLPSTDSAPLSPADFLPHSSSVGVVRTFLSQPTCELTGKQPAEYRGEILAGSAKDPNGAVRLESVDTIGSGKDPSSTLRLESVDTIGSGTPPGLPRGGSVRRAVAPELERVASAVSDATSGSMSPHRRGSSAVAASPPAELNLDESMPSQKPEADLAVGVSAVMHANSAKRQELDWVRHNEAIHSMRTLVKHHPSVVYGKLKEVLEAMLPCAGALRSSTLKSTLCFFQVRSLTCYASMCEIAHADCYRKWPKSSDVLVCAVANDTESVNGSHCPFAMQELLEQLGSKLSGDLEEIVPALLKKAADVSTAGRENFLTQYADAALSQMVLSCAEAPTAKALLSMCVILVS